MHRPMRGVANTYSYGYGDYASSIGNPDGDGNGYGSAATYPDAKAASDASAAPDSITVTGTIKTGTRESNSRVTRLWRIGFTRGGHGTFKQSWHFPDATPGDLNTGGVYAGRKVSGREQLIIQL
jgi:hypothetical protein